MTRFRCQYRAETVRLKGWDYSSAGWYVITIRTKDRACSLGDVVNGEMRLSPIGEIAQRYWEDIPDHFPNVRLDVFVVMPNHMHGIVIIGDSPDITCRDVACNVSTSGGQ